MIEAFTASNGREIEDTNGCSVRLYYRTVFGSRTNSLEKYDHLDSADLLALREYFQSKQDVDLGMWRSKKDPRYVGFSTATGAVRLVDSTTGDVGYYTSRQAAFPDDPFSPIAAEYFKDTAPLAPAWYEAKVGEVWEITSDLGVFVALVSEGDNYNYDRGITYFVFYQESEGKNNSYPVTSTAITSARRIHPA